MNRWIIGCVALAMLVAAGNVEAGIVLGDGGGVYGDLIFGDATVTFDEAGASLGSIDTVLTISGVDFGEGFSGQPLSPSGGFDVLDDGRDVDPLVVLPGASGANLQVLSFSSYNGNVLAGLGPGPGDQVGEGAISILFPVTQTVVAFEVIGADGGAGYIDVYATDGSHLSQYVIQPLTNSTPGDPVTVDAFALNLSQPFQGITFTNLNSGGAGIDNVRFSTTPASPPGEIPEPASLIIWSALALLGIVVGWRRRKRA